MTDQEIIDALKAGETWDASLSQETRRKSRWIADATDEQSGTSPG